VPAMFQSRRWRTETAAAAPGNLTAPALCVCVGADGSSPTLETTGSICSADGPTAFAMLYSG
jgi:hypothetical protein